MIVCDCTKPYSAFWLVIHCTAYFAEKISLRTLACGFCISRKSVTEGGGWDHPQGAMHMAALAARIGCERAMVSTRRATSHLIAWTGLENTTVTL